MNKTTEQLIEEFLANGGKIEKLSTVESSTRSVVGSTSKKTPELMTLAEGELMFGKKQERQKKEKEQDYSDIDLSLIPDHLHEFIKKSAKKEQDINKGDDESEAN